MTFDLNSTTSSFHFSFCSHKQKRKRLSHRFEQVKRSSPRKQPSVKVSEAKSNIGNPRERRTDEVLTQNQQNKKDVYNFFSNSVHDSDHSQSELRQKDAENHTHHSHSFNAAYQTYPFKPCRLCAPHEAHMNRSLCQMHFDRNLPNPNAFLCDACLAMPICLNCREEMCLRCRRPLNSPAVRSPHKRQKSPIVRNLKLPNESYDRSDTNDDDSQTTNQTSENVRSKPYSFSVDRSSILHPSRRSEEAKPISINVRNGEVTIDQNLLDDENELKRFTNERLSRLARTYGDMRARSVPRSTPANDIDSYPLPLIPPNQTKPSLDFDRQFDDSGENTVAFKQLESRWQVPIVERHRVIQDHDNSVSLLTQIGTFKKQLQMEKLNLTDSEDDQMFAFKRI